MTLGVPASVLASIPSPPDNAIHIGPLQLRAYGLAIAVGVVAAVTLAQRRWAGRGGDPADISRLAVGSVLAGLAGARAYHVLTDWQRFEGRWWHALAVWEGGLGIPGGLLAGVLTGVWLGHRRGLPVGQLLDVAAPAIPVAQAIGRLGNWFNQELFGRPTDLPWGLEIDRAHRPAGYADIATFHPTFLYEALWNLALAAALVLYERRRSTRAAAAAPPSAPGEATSTSDEPQLDPGTDDAPPTQRPGTLFALYVAGYAVGRFWVEALRIDPASRLLGVRVNLWTSGVALLAAVAWLVATHYRTRPATDAADDHPGPRSGVGQASGTSPEHSPEEDS